jgi:hypothetical protein
MRRSTILSFPLHYKYYIRVALTDSDTHSSLFQDETRRYNTQQNDIHHNKLIFDFLRKLHWALQWDADMLNANILSVEVPKELVMALNALSYRLCMFEKVKK